MELFSLFSLASLLRNGSDNKEYLTVREDILVFPKAEGEKALSYLCSTMGFKDEKMITNDTQILINRWGNVLTVWLEISSERGGRGERIKENTIYTLLKAYHQKAIKDATKEAKE